MDSQKEKMFRDYAWAYFAYHADQRMKTFNFFLIAAGLLAGAIATLLKDEGHQKWVAVLGFLLFFLSLIFWKIDQRNRSLVKNGEAALKFLDDLHGHPDQSGVPHVLRIFHRDDHHTDSASAFPIASGHFSYTKCLGLVFWLFALLGLFLALGILCQKDSVTLGTKSLSITTTSPELQIKVVSTNAFPSSGAHN